MGFTKRIFGSIWRPVLAVIIVLSLPSCHSGRAFRANARAAEIKGPVVQGSADTRQTLLKQQEEVWKNDVNSTPAQRHARRGLPGRAAPPTTPQSITTERRPWTYSYPIPPEVPDVGKNRNAPGEPNTETSASGNNFGSVGAPVPIAP